MIVLIIMYNIVLYALLHGLRLLRRRGRGRGSRILVERDCQVQRKSLHDRQQIRYISTNQVQVPFFSAEVAC